MTMTRLFRRKPIAELLAHDDASPQALRRVLGAGDLVMLAIGAVIGAGTPKLSRALRGRPATGLSRP